MNSGFLSATWLEIPFVRAILVGWVVFIAAIVSVGLSPEDFPATAAIVATLSVLVLAKLRGEKVTLS